MGRERTQVQAINLIVDINVNIKIQRLTVKLQTVIDNVIQNHNI